MALCTLICSLLVVPVVRSCSTSFGLVHLYLLYDKDVPFLMSFGEGVERNWGWGIGTIILRINPHGS
ncbi:MAG: hypothetical protein RLZ47_305 [Bacteroidota bacterium]|jgi:hypothetical protein